ncbi:hypothetical protein D3C71_2117290 [compost metagenome]
MAQAGPDFLPIHEEVRERRPTAFEMEAFQRTFQAQFEDGLGLATTSLRRFVQPHQAVCV